MAAHRAKALKVAVVQAAPVLFDLSASVDKAAALIAKAAQQHSELVLLPEAFLPGYPRGLSFGMRIGSRSDSGRELWQQYWDNALHPEHPAYNRLQQAIAEAQAYVAIGVIEREQHHDDGTLYCSLFYFGPDGRLLGKHRKLKPTASERLIWGEGDGSTLSAINTPFGAVGGLICWENYMPLARMTMYAQGVALYLAPTADARDSWQASMRHIACEGRCFVLASNQFVTRSMYPESLRNLSELDDQPEVLCRGGSVIVSPMGEVIAGPLYDREDTLYAELDLNEITRAKVDFDVTGHYARNDLFQLSVNTEVQHSVVFGPRKPAD